MREEQLIRWCADLRAQLCSGEAITLFESNRPIFGQLIVEGLREAMLAAEGDGDIRTARIYAGNLSELVTGGRTR